MKYKRCLLAIFEQEFRSMRKVKNDDLKMHLYLKFTAWKCETHMSFYLRCPFSFNHLFFVFLSLFNFSWFSCIFFICICYFALFLAYLVLLITLFFLFIFLLSLYLSSSSSSLIFDLYVFQVNFSCFLSRLPDCHSTILK